MSHEQESPRYSSGRARRIFLRAGIASFFGSAVMFYVSEWFNQEYSIAKEIPAWAGELEIGAFLGCNLGILLLIIGLSLPSKGKQLRGQVGGKQIGAGQSSASLGVVLGMSLAVFVFMVGALFNAGAEAFYGAKEPMFEMLGGFVLGGIIATGLVFLIQYLRRSGWIKLSVAVICAIILFDIAVIPFCRWIIRLAYASPNHVIDFRDLW
jgi:hypothetical protein